MTYTLGQYQLNSRLIIGTGKYPNFQVMQAAIEASGADMVTVAIRRVNFKGAPEENLLNHLNFYHEGEAPTALPVEGATRAPMITRNKFRLLPNTAGCYTAKDAILTCELAREALDTSLVKLEVIGCEKTLFPDNEALLEAAKVLVKEGFTVLPYCIDDPIVCKKLEDIGCAAVMPLAAPIGSGLGIRNPTNLKIIIEQARVPVIVDAGVGCASDAAICMELGASAVLMNTAIAGAKDPVKMAGAMKAAVEAGRLSFEAGRIPKKLYATASSPVEGMIGVPSPSGEGQGEGEVQVYSPSSGLRPPSPEGEGIRKGSAI